MNRLYNGYSDYKNRNSQSGQVLVVVLLVMLVGLTVGLGALNRATQDTALTTRIEESTQSFSAAEAGMELALRGALTQSGSGTVANSTYNVTIAPQGNTVDAVYPDSPASFVPGEVFTLWLVNHNANNTLNEVATYTSPTVTVCWNSTGGATTTAIMATLVYKKAAGTYRTAYAAYDPINGRTNNGGKGNSFIFNGVGSSGGYCGGSYQYSTDITWSSMGGIVSGIAPTTDILIALRVQPVYGGAQIAAKPASGVAFPQQGTLFTSEGTTGTTNRQIKVFKSYSVLPAVFDFILFSKGGLVK